MGVPTQIRIQIYCPADTTIRINHQIMHALGTNRRFLSRVDDDNQHFYRITVQSRKPENKFEGDFYLSHSANTNNLTIYFDPSAGKKTLVWLNGKRWCPKYERSDCPEPPPPETTSASAFNDNVLAAP